MTLIISLLTVQFILVYLSSYVAEQSVEFAAIFIALYSYISQKTALNARMMRLVFLLFALDLCFDLATNLIQSSTEPELNDTIPHHSVLYVVAAISGAISQVTKIVLTILLWRSSVKY